MATTARKKPARRTKAAARIECEACLEIAQAETLLAAVNKALEQPDPVVVQAGQIETITTPCIQVFCALARALQSREQHIQWESPSQKLQDVAKILGVQKTLGLPGA